MSARELHRATLDNGLRVLVAPVSGAPVVGVAVHYGVGFRDEPPGRGGFAHLFEHVMFQGSAHVPRLGHFTLVQEAGGTANGSTHQDYTDYYQVVPASALERALFLEADRMRGPRLDAETLATQVRVVQEEILLVVRNRPYGGFPWTVLPEVLYQSFANAHNGYGDLRDLERATPQECADFFERHYTSAGAVLTVAGAVDPDEVLDLVQHHFGDVPARPAPPPADRVEPAAATQRRGLHHDPHAPLPAVALGWPVPDPAAGADAYLAHLALCALLATGETSRLSRALVQAGRAVDVSAGTGFFGPFHARDPETLLVVATHPVAVAPQELVDVVDAELARLSLDGPTPGELERITRRGALRAAQSGDDLLARTRALGALEVLFGLGGLVDELPARWAAVPAEGIAAAAAGLRPERCGVLELVPAGVPLPIAS